MIGSWLIDRESTHDTLKNIMTIPVSMPKMLGAKLFWVGIFAVLLGIYSVGVTLITGLTVGLSGLTVEVFFHGGTQIVLAALTTYLVCMPLILILGRSEGHIWEVPFWRFSLDIACCSSKAVSLPASIRFLLR